MNRSRARELLPIIEAFANGEDVQIRSGDNKWSTFTIFGDGMGPDWSDDCVYRIAPQPREFLLNTMDNTVHDPSNYVTSSALDSRWIFVREVL